jgi:hypothetical protein
MQILLALLVGEGPDHLAVSDAQQGRPEEVGKLFAPQGVDQLVAGYHSVGRDEQVRQHPVLVAGTYGLVCSQATNQAALGIWLFGPITMTS